MTEPVTHAPNSRDDRIDFLRGLALLVICIDHIHGNPLTLLTPAAFGLFDMSEVFLFLSGIVSMWSVQQIRERSGFQAAIRRCWRRTLVLYVAYVLAGTGLLLLMRMTSTVFQLPTHREAALFANPIDLLFRVATLQQHVGHLCILLLYAISLLILPLAVLVQDNRWIRRLFPLLLLSCYLSVQLKSGTVPFSNKTQLVLYYDPLAWVPLFLLGGWCGLFHRSTWEAPWLSAIAIVVLLVLTAGHIWGEIIPASALLKPSLGLARLAHFLCLAILAVNILPRSSPWYVASIRTCGRNSLATYLFGAVISIVFSTGVPVSQHSLFELVMVNFSAVSGTVLAAELARTVTMWWARWGGRQIACASPENSG